ncbi:MAG: selenocysteine-specific translation elongation factor [Candidatus Latescibacterota bacterium]|nr:MAG: selenocysteine-specific translation elongation factor [Candidatus Latescibacterota bacterium]
MTKRRFILGTAGHVDHGKTQLVSRLTGWDTDRLKEEKERGISIELGFAPLPLDPETTLGVVDVPGHERFVKNMVAGAGGIDLAMLVVAADEGVMPQTKEHLEVLNSLAIESGVVVISKTDLATEEMLAIVKDEVADLVGGTFLENAHVVETSAKTGAGVDELKHTLKQLADRVTERDIAGPFRLAVDRVFHKQGIGVVVTGSCYSGAATVGASLELLPSEKTVRVREIQSFGEKRETGYAGERLAIALQGAKLDEVGRGDMLVTPSEFVISYMFDARVNLAKYAQFELKQRERIRLHHGAKEVLGRAVLLESDELRSGDSGLVQMRLESPIVGAEGDYFVIRKYSPSMVFGGGRIIDARATKHRRRDQAVVDRLRLHERGDPKDKLSQIVEAAGLRGADAEAHDLAVIRELIAEGDIVDIDGTLFHRRALETLADTVFGMAEDYARTHPLRYGIDKEEVRQRTRFPHATPLFNNVLDVLTKLRPIFVRDNRVRSGSENLELADDVAEEIRRLEDIIREPGLLFKKQADIEKEWKGKSRFQDALRLLRETGVVERIGEDGYVHRESLEWCVKELSRFFQKSSELAVGEFKDMFGITRKHAIPLLEHLDEARVTTRDGNIRRRGPQLERVNGEGTPGGRGSF